MVDTRGARIQGWAHDPSAQAPVTIDVYVDGVKVGSTVADRMRADLVSVCPQGRCAFEFTLPAPLLDGSVRTVEVRVQGTRRRLLRDRFTEALLPANQLFEMFRAALRSGCWSMKATPTDSAINISGWCIAPPGVDRGVITANGHPIDVAMSEGASGWQSALPPGMAVRTFTGTVPRDLAAKDMHFSFGLDRAFSPLQDLYYPLFEVPMPEAERRKRVDGHGLEASFNLSGYSNATKLDNIALRFADRPLSGLGPVLDWGCGCGRVARFVARSGADLFGVDIDAENARWCRDHISTNFFPISPDPPTTFASDFFGAIYGISVFTHLSRDYEKAWLAELHRIAKPGALLLMSVHGSLMAAYSGMTEHIVSSEFPDGFADIGRNYDIDVVTQGSTYYRNVFHQPGYIGKVWGEFFEILSIEEGVIENLHDLVVARKRG